MANEQTGTLELGEVSNNQVTNTNIASEVKATLVNLQNLITGICKAIMNLNIAREITSNASHILTQLNDLREQLSIAKLEQIELEKSLGIVY